MKLYFDLDGTLFQTEITVLAAARAFFDELRLQYPGDEEILTHVGRPMKVFMRNIMGVSAVTDEDMRHFRSIEHAIVRQQGKLFDGVKTMLTSLKKDGHATYVCSNGGPEYIELVLSSTGIRECFDDIYTAREYPSKAEKVREVLRGDTNAVFIGDTGDDRLAARQNDIPFIAALYGYGGDAVKDENAYNAGAPEDICAIVKKLEIFRVITDALGDNKRVVGINGVDTSGKTLFSEGYAKYLRSIGKDAALIHIDDFHNPLAIRRNGATENDAYYDNAFNYAQLISEVLLPLKETGAVRTEVLCLDLDTDTYSRNVRFDIAPETVVIIEGVLLFRPPLLGFFDLKVFLDITFDEVLRRARERDVPKYGEMFFQKYEKRYIPVQKRYLNEFKPKQNCDVLVDNNDYRRPNIKEGG